MALLCELEEKHDIKLATGYKNNQENMLFQISSFAVQASIVNAFAIGAYAVTSPPHWLLLYSIIAR